MEEQISETSMDILDKKDFFVEKQYKNKSSLAKKLFFSLIFLTLLFTGIIIILILIKKDGLI